MKVVLKLTVDLPSARELCAPRFAELLRYHANQVAIAAAGQMGITSPVAEIPVLGRKGRHDVFGLGTVTWERELHEGEADEA